MGSTLNNARMSRRTVNIVFIFLALGMIICDSRCEAAPFDIDTNELAQSVGIAVKAPPSGAGLSSAFWDNTKPGSFER